MQFLNEKCSFQVGRTFRWKVGTLKSYGKKWSLFYDRFDALFWRTSFP